MRVACHELQAECTAPPASTSSVASAEARLAAWLKPCMCRLLQLRRAMRACCRSCPAACASASCLSWLARPCGPSSCAARIPRWAVKGRVGQGLLRGRPGLVGKAGTQHMCVSPHLLQAWRSFTRAVAQHSRHLMAAPPSRSRAAAHGSAGLSGMSGTLISALLYTRTPLHRMARSAQLQPGPLAVSSMHHRHGMLPAAARLLALPPADSLHLGPAGQRADGARRVMPGGARPAAGAGDV